MAKGSIFGALEGSRLDLDLISTTSRAAPRQVCGPLECKCNYCYA